MICETVPQSMHDWKSAVMAITRSPVVACSRLSQRQWGSNGRWWSCAVTVERATTQSMKIAGVHTTRCQQPVVAHWEVAWCYANNADRCDVLLLAIGRLLLLALDFWTVYLLTSGLPRHSQHLVGSWKLIYFGNLTQTLCYNYVTIVVLEVILT